VRSLARRSIRFDLMPCCPTDGGSTTPNSADRQRWGTAPAARTITRIDWNELLGVSCNRLLGRASLRSLVFVSS
jgi:hypothetical protein